MMNLARFSVGMEGVGIAERAYQRAVAYARDRVQGKAVGLDEGGEGEPDHRASGHPPHADDDARVHRGDARRRLRHGCRDGQRAPPSRRRSARKQHQAFVDFMIPIVKGMVDGNRAGRRLARRAGARRHGLHRGNGRRAALARCAHHDDLRRHDRHPGERSHRPQDGARWRRAVAQIIAGEMRQGRGASSRRDPSPRCKPIGVQLASSHARTCSRAVEWMVAGLWHSSRAPLTPARWPTSSCGDLAAGGWQMGRAALIAADRLAGAKATRSSSHAKIATARFYADCRCCRRRPPMRAHDRAGGETALALPPSSSRRARGSRGTARPLRVSEGDSSSAKVAIAD